MLFGLLAGRTATFQQAGVNDEVRRDGFLSGLRRLPEPRIPPEGKQLRNGYLSHLPPLGITDRREPWNVGA